MHPISVNSGKVSWPFCGLAAWKCPCGPSLDLSGCGGLLRSDKYVNGPHWAIRDFNKFNMDLFLCGLIQRINVKLKWYFLIEKLHRQKVINHNYFPMISLHHFEVILCRSAAASGQILDHLKVEYEGLKCSVSRSIENHFMVLENFNEIESFRYHFGFRFVFWIPIFLVLVQILIFFWV